MNEFKTFNGSPTVDGYYTTFDSSEVHRVDESSDSGGGSGSGDFSTAEITITDNTTDGLQLWIPNVMTHGEMPAIVPHLATLGGGASTNAVVALYGNGAIARLDAATDIGATINTSGDITPVEIDHAVYLITGDCTITIS